MPAASVHFGVHSALLQWSTIDSMSMLPKSSIDQRFVTSRRVMARVRLRPGRKTVPALLTMAASLESSQATSVLWTEYLLTRRGSPWGSSWSVKRTLKRFSGSRPNGSAST